MGQPRILTNQQKCLTVFVIFHFHSLLGYISNTTHLKAMQWKSNPQLCTMVSNILTSPASPVIANHGFTIFAFFSALFCFLAFFSSFLLISSGVRCFLLFFTGDPSLSLLLSSSLRFRFSGLWDVCKLPFGKLNPPRFAWIGASASLSEDPNVPRS